MKPFFREANKKEIEYIDAVYAEFKIGFELSENDRLIVTNNICAIIEYFWSDVELSTLSYNEMDNMVSSLENVWYDGRGSLLYFIKVGK